MLITFIIILLIFVFLTPIFAFAIALLAQIKKRGYITKEQTTKEAQEKGLLSSEFLNKKYEVLDITQNHNKPCFLHYYKNSDSNNSTILLTPGFACDWTAMLAYAELFYSEKWNVAILNHTPTEKSVSPVSLGYKESQYIFVAVKKLKELFCDCDVFGLMGVSMGAAASLLTKAPVDFIISDCSFSSLKKLAISILSSLKIPRFFSLPVCFFASIFYFIISGNWLFKANCLKTISKTNVPLLIIHGKEDSLVPPKMAIEIRDAREKKFPNTSSVQFISKNGGRSHGENYANDPNLWKKTVFTFLSGVTKCSTHQN